MMTVKSFNANLAPQAAFFLARVGDVGKPLREPYTSTNSFIVLSDEPELDYQRVTAAYHSKRFYVYQVGSCQPFIRLKDVRSEIENINGLVSDKYLLQMEALQKVIDIQEQKLEKTRQLLLSLQLACMK